LWQKKFKRALFDHSFNYRFEDKCIYFLAPNHIGFAAEKIQKQLETARNYLLPERQTFEITRAFTS
jgi:hypothetical protein